MRDVFIYDHVRTPRGKGKPGGALHEIPAVQLVSQLLRAVRDRSELDTALIDDVAIGCSQPVAEQGGVLARAALLEAGYAQSVAGQQVHRFCASGLEAINNIAGQIISGMVGAAIAGGVESMSRVPLGTDSGAWVADPRVAYHNHFAPQGIGADIIATLESYSREDVDAYALESQKRAARAWDEGRFSGAIVPIRDVLGEVVLDNDEHRRPNTTMDSLAALKPAFAAQAELGFGRVALERYPDIERLHHVHTGGNSSGIVDGAGVVLLGNRELGEALGVKPRARIRAWASIGSDPTVMLTAPVAVAQKALRNAGMEQSDIDLFELNEAFASVVMRFVDYLSIDHARINVNGGAIALGHPLGATGAMLLGTALDELERSGRANAMTLLCAGNGLGTATIIERI